MFGVLKAKARKVYLEFFFEKSEEKMTKERAAKFLIDAWDGISAATIQSAWDVYDCPGEYAEVAG